MKALMKNLLFLTVLAVVASTAHAAIDPANVQKLIAGDYFGYSVSVSGDTAVIGAWADNDNGTASGSAYVFVRADNGIWSQQAKLTAEDGASWDRFGWSVSVSGDTTVIGVLVNEDYSTASGAAYVFVRAADGTWSQQAKLTAAEGAADDYFGGSVAVYGDTAVIGAFWDDDKGLDSGSAYVFVRASDGTWSQQAKLTAAEGENFDYFGQSVAVSGDIAVIGAYGDDYYSGAAYVFIRADDGIWSQQAKLTVAYGGGLGLVRPKCGCVWGHGGHRCPWR